ncbi:MAG: site-2 protease family protein [Nitrospirae bacterium]|nr:site-2 protease family protein [Nitrospirota bacterium]
MHMLGHHWQIGRILGIPIKIHISWYLVFAFVTWALATGYLPESLPGQSFGRYWGMAGVTALCLFLSVLLHELGHSAVAQRYRIPIGQITLFVFGGVAHMQREPPRPKAEFLIAIAGPAVSFVLAGVLLSVSVVVEGKPGLAGFWVLALLIGTVNLQLGLFNLIPGFPLDGGRVLRAGLWAWLDDLPRATRLSALAGRGFGLFLAVTGVTVMLGAALGRIPGAIAANGGWLTLLGLFLFAAAKGGLRQAALHATLARIPVAEVMVRDVVTIDGEMTVEEAVARYFLTYGFGGFPVVEGGQIIGMVATNDLQGLSRTLWSWRKVRDIMTPWSPAMEIGPDASAYAAIDQMVRDGQSRLGVVKDGGLIGLVTRTGIMRFVQVQGIDPPAG